MNSVLIILFTELLLTRSQHNDVPSSYLKKYLENNSLPTKKRLNQILINTCRVVMGFYTAKANEK